MSAHRDGTAALGGSLLKSNSFIKRRLRAKLLIDYYIITKEYYYYIVICLIFGLSRKRIELVCVVPLLLSFSFSLY